MAIIIMRMLAACLPLQLLLGALLCTTACALTYPTASPVDPTLIGLKSASQLRAALFHSATARSPQLTDSSTRCAVLCCASSDVVQTVYGGVEGYTAYGVNHYLGIPFAAPPVGPLRFRQPQPPEPWKDTRHAFLSGSPCPQVLDGQLWIGREDCLYLNVYSPANASTSGPLPVLVWLYGGAFVFGDGYEFGLYSATQLVSTHRSYIVVTLNYRLAALGFLALDSLRANSTHNSSGNLGIWDQLAALQWVQANIAAFGGDPSQVTIVGESAGAMSVCIHMASRLSRGLFSAAVMESGTCDSETFYVPFEANVQWSVLFANAVGCSGADSAELLDCLQRVPVDKLVLTASVNSSTPPVPQPRLRLAAAALPTSAASASYVDLRGLPNTLETVRRLYSHDIPLSSLAVSNGSTPPVPLPVLYPTIPWTPTLDGALLLDTPLASIRSGDWARVPLVIGTNKDEGTLFLSQLYSILPGQLHDPLVDSDLPLILYHVFNDSSVVDAVLAAYPLSAYPSVNNLTAVILRDYVFACPSRRVAAAASSANSSGAVWLYEFEYVGDWVEDASLGVYHSSELEFVFDNAWPPLVHSFSKRDQRMADAFGAYWANLVVHGDVNEGETVERHWPAWTSDEQRSVRLDVPVQADSRLHADTCDFWDSLADQRRNTTRSASSRSRLRAATSVE